MTPKDFHFLYLLQLQDATLSCFLQPKRLSNAHQSGTGLNSCELKTCGPLVLLFDWLSLGTSVDQLMIPGITLFRSSTVIISQQWALLK